MVKSSRWDRFLYPLSKDVDTTFCTAVTAELSKCGPVSEFLSNLVVTGRIREVVEFPMSYDTGVEDFRGASQIQALFKKNLDLDLGFNPLKAGVEASIKAELQCQETNRYFGALCPLGGVTQAVSLARRKILRVLGPVPVLRSLKGRFGPGATTEIKRSAACPENKLGRTVVCSKEMLPYVHTFLAETPAWAGYHSEGWSTSRTCEGSEVSIESSGVTPVGVDPGKLIFVEKNAKTHRPICVEPVFNGFWQLGVGDYIKDRLRVHANQDLSNQERNQLLAREGSVTGKLATVDLSSASDTLAFSVVFDLLPEDWVDLLSSLRTGSISYAGHEYELEKFSSMGNGFTFELESLIFWALASSCTELRGEDTNYVSVYGDDIIVPIGAVDLLYATLSWCGFSVNPDKSFTSGPFRESCGADWLNGEDVRPIFKKDRISYQWLYVFHNWAMRRGEIRLAAIAKSLIPSDWQLSGPDGYGDGHLLGSWEMIKPRAVKRGGWGGGYFHTLREVSKSVETDKEIAHLTGLYALYTRGCSQWWDPREAYRPGTVPGSLWVERTSIYTFAEHIFVR
jgi:hypothetical protein